MGKSNLLIREKKLPKNQIIEQKNREVSQEGKARKQDEVNLQAGLQKSLSDIVREDGAVSDERAKNGKIRLKIVSLANLNDVRIAVVGVERSIQMSKFTCSRD